MASEAGSKRGLEELDGGEGLVKRCRDMARETAGLTADAVTNLEKCVGYRDDMLSSAANLAEYARVCHLEMRSAVVCARELYEIKGKSHELDTIARGERAKEREEEVRHITAMAMAKKEAERIIAQGEMPRPADPYPGAASFLSEDRTLAGMHREREGFGQRSIFQFIGGVHNHHGQPPQ